MSPTTEKSHVSDIAYKAYMSKTVICYTVQYKNFGSKKLWQIRTVRSLAEKLWQIEVHLHRECYGNCENW